MTTATSLTRIPWLVGRCLFAMPVFYGQVRGESRGGPRFDNRAFVRVFVTRDGESNDSVVQVGKGHGSDDFGRFVVVMSDQNVGNSVTNSVEDLARESLRLIRTHRDMKGADINLDAVTFIEHYPATVGSPRRSVYGDFKRVDLEWDISNLAKLPSNPRWTAISDDEVDALIGMPHWRPDECLISPKGDDTPMYAEVDESTGVVMAGNMADVSLFKALSDISDKCLKVEIRYSDQSVEKRYILAGGIYPDHHPLACAWVASATGNIGPRAKPLNLSSIREITHKGIELWKPHL